MSFLKSVTHTFGVWPLDAPLLDSITTWWWFSAHVLDSVDLCSGEGMGVSRQRKPEGRGTDLSVRPSACLSVWRHSTVKVWCRRKAALLWLRWMSTSYEGDQISKGIWTNSRPAGSLCCLSVTSINYRYATCETSFHGWMPTTCRRWVSTWTNDSWTSANRVLMSGSGTAEPAG